jgi:putative hydrolase of the HAD superfamily
MSKSPIKNLIFDFGGVIIDIHPMTYVEEMLKLGNTNVSEMHESFIREKVYRRFETGALSADEFRDLIRANLPNHATNAQIDHAWNLIIGEIPGHRMDFLVSLKAKYRTFLLSNTNPIHYDHYQEYTRKTFGMPSLDSLFEKAFFSFKLGLYKPDHDIFQFVLQDSGLDPAETVFIDDMEENVEAARQCGMQGIHLAEGMDVTEILIKTRSQGSGKKSV